MGEVKLFQDITTSEALAALEAEGASYEGLYVEMDDPEQRKYVKDKAALIAGLIKKLDRARIDKSKAYKLAVDAEAAEIKSRLESANKPFTLLIDEWNAERKKILDAKKAKEAEKERLETIERDHELGLLMNVQWDADAEKREAERRAKEEQIAEQARQMLLAAQEAKAKQEEAEKQARLADVEHKRKVNNLALSDLVSIGLTNEQAKTVVVAIANNAISNVQINY